MKPILFTSSLAALTLSAPALARQSYTVVDLGVLPGHEESRAWDMNDAGQVVGWSRSGSALRATLYDPSAGISEVGVLPGQTNSAARGINELGEIVGSSWAAPISQPGAPFLRQANGTLLNLGSLAGGSTAEAFGVNDAGVVVGMAQGTGFSPEPFRTTATAGSLTPLTQGQAGNAYAVNLAGTIAGEANGRATLWDAAGVATPLPFDPAFPRTRAQAINGAGVAAGIEEDPSGTTAHLVRWADVGLEDLGIIGRYSYVTSINDAGWIVGYDQFSFQAPARAFLYTPNLGRRFVEDLLAPGSTNWTITSVFAVNAAGQLAANGVNLQGEKRALRLDPVGASVLEGATVFCAGEANSTGAAATLDATDIDLNAGTMKLVSTNLPLNRFGISLVSRSASYVVAPGGSFGDLCLGAPIGRLVGGAFLNSGPTGSWIEPVDLTSLPAAVGGGSVLAGETWYFQAWYRDEVTGTTGSNFSDGIRVRF